MKTLYLPNEILSELKQVWGIPIFGKEEEIEKEYKRLIEEKKFKKIITIGDRCSNPPGTIQEEVWSIIEKAIKENKNVFVDGEEDLLVIPAVLLAKDHSAVVYGFFNKGICLIEVSDKIKNTFKELLKRFN